MGLIGKVEAETEIKSCGDLFHEMFSSRPHHISNACPEKVQGVDLHEGDWGTVGSVVVWNYVLDGNAETAKETVEAIDVENKSVTYNVFEGDLMKQYKSLKIIVQVTPKGENSNLVKWTMVYEKLNEDVPPPNKLLEFAIHVTKDIESHHLQA